MHTTELHVLIFPACFSEEISSGHENLLHSVKWHLHGSLECPACLNSETRFFYIFVIFEIMK